MKIAIDKVLSREMGYKKAASAYAVPQTTLERYVKKMKEGGEVTIGLPLGPKKSIFTTKEEGEIEAYLKYMEERLFGLTTIELRRLAYQLAVKNGKAHNFNTDKEMAGVDWLKGFLKRHQNLSIRKPEATSAARAMGFNKVAVSKFYQLLGDIYDKYELTPDKIYNCDETGISVVSKTKSKILAMKGRKQVGSLSSAERGQTITVEICFNAAGTYMPPLMIFPRQRMKPELLDAAPPGTTAVCNPRGWITSEIFLTWFKNFIKFSGATPTNHVLLLLDGHVSHTKNLEVIDLARKNGVIILCFPPHCTHRLQPADVAFMKPLSTYYDHAVTGWLRSHPGRVVTVFQISEIFGNAYLQAATMSTAINAFRKCGIWPYNLNNFTDADFISAETTNINIADSSNVEQQRGSEPESLQSGAVPYLSSTTTVTTVSSTVVTTSHTETVAAEPEATPSTSPRTELITECYEHVTPRMDKTPIREPEPGCSYYPEPSIRAACRDLTSSFSNASPGDILPIPSVQRTEKRKQYRRGKTAIITSTPYKNELENLKKPGKTSNPNDPRLKKNHKNKQKTKPSAKQHKSDDEDAICLYLL
ncbi:uncharacterized protein LOC112904326 [Agrilus planipennis]|uniref:Uncharacterized protein LOC112904326 n=1 Tax=Agrilus planipennis TaxID=224129 RepID=A0A7F5R3P1_AGRPL|nr:uncharacterized protein LOC112904326 [Agrilus planipennis]